jgi:hypothetical protein
MTDEVVNTPAVEPQGSPVTESVSESTDTSPTLSVEEYSNHRVPVKLDGEELQVPLSEAIAGYQRQADYTRKTQELAQQREQFQFATALQSALDNDPAATIDLLSKHYGISRQAVSEMIADGEDFDSLDPTEQKYRELDKRLASFEDYQSKQEIEREVQRLKSKYEDFNINEVVTTALRMNSTDLEGTYKQIAFDKMMAKAELERQAREVQQQKENSLLESKRQASVVSGGSSAMANTTSENFQPITSVAEAWAAAKRSMGAK